MSQKKELLVTGFVRRCMTIISMDIPEDINPIIVLFYPWSIGFEGNTVNLTETEKEMITSWFIDVFALKDKWCTLSSRLLYDFDVDGPKGSDFHRQCVNANNTFSIVRTEFNGHIFGCFLSKPFPQDDFGWTDIGDNKAFVCVIRSCFADQIPKLFKIKQNEQDIKNAYANNKSFGPIFGTSADLKLLDRWGDVGSNYVNHHNTIFDNGLCGNILCGGDKYSGVNYHRFTVEKMTTFEIHIHQD